MTPFVFLQCLIKYTEPFFQSQQKNYIQNTVYNVMIVSNIQIMLQLFQLLSQMSPFAFNVVSPLLRFREHYVYFLTF